MARPLALESHALPTALHGPASLTADNALVHVKGCPNGMSNALLHFNRFKINEGVVGWCDGAG